MRPGIIVLLIPGLLLGAGACSSDDPAATPGVTAPADDSATASTSTVVTSLPAEDGVLRLGVLAPLTGDGAPIGLSVQATVEFAVAQINGAGGVNGKPVQLRIADEGADIATATAGLDDLVKADVDAIIGPTSSTVTLSVLDTIRRSQILACSATATAMSLDDFPDDGLFFRTAPSDSLEAEAMARAIDQTGRSSVGLLYVDDAYGRPFADRLRQALAARSIALTASVPYSPADSGSDTAAKISEVLGSQVVAVIGAADSGARTVRAVVEATPAADTPIVVNDAMRGAPAADTFAQFSDAAISRIIGVAPRSSTDNTEFLEALRASSLEASGLFAVNAFDCVNLIALAATAVGSSQPREIAGRIPSVAASGSRCLTFTDCSAGLMAGRNVDYDGPSSVLQLAFDGDPNRGVYDVFGYTADGSERDMGFLTVNV